MSKDQIKNQDLRNTIANMRTVMSGCLDGSIGYKDADATVRAGYVTVRAVEVDTIRRIAGVDHE